VAAAWHCKALHAVLPGAVDLLNNQLSCFLTLVLCWAAAVATLAMLCCATYTPFMEVHAANMDQIALVMSCSADAGQTSGT
jgi:hypothetical protein